jgi:iron(III) transport system ATP-binding protein
MSIEIANLHKAFGPVVAVNRLTLSVPEGQMLVLLGPSGCGKTTTMRCIAGLERPNGGTITIAGKPMFDASRGINVPVNERNLGMVFQSYAIWPHMSVFDNVAFPLRVKNLDRRDIEGRVAEILAQVGLTEFASRGASYLSGGQMQRVALARSLVMRPSVLLFDEPLSNLDARLRDRLRIQLRELQTQFNITSVYVTHDQHEALALADQIAVMHRGDLLQLAEPVSIYSRPTSSTVADFLGYSNIFAVGELRRRDTHCEAVLKDGGATLHAVEAPPAGEAEIFACIRPEDIGIGRLEAGTAPKAGALDGEATLASFMGAYMQYRVRTQGGLTLEVFSRDIHAGIRPGTSVRLEIPPPVVLLLPRL